MTSALHKLIVRTWNLGTWIVWRSKYPEPRTQTPKLGCTKWQSYQPIGIWMVQQLSLGWYVICLLLLRYWCTFTYFLVVHMFIVCSREEAGLTPSDWDVLGSFYQEEKREPEKITWAAPFRRNTWPRPWPDLSDRSCEWKKAGTSTGGGGNLTNSILRDGEIWGQPHYYLWKIPFYLKGWDGFEGCERFIKIVWNPLDGSGKDRWVALFLRACLYLGNSLSTLQVAPWSVFVTTSPQAVVEKSTVLGMKSLQASSLRH